MFSQKSRFLKFFKLLLDRDFNNTFKTRHLHIFLVSRDVCYPLRDPDFLAKNRENGAFITIVQPRAFIGLQVPSPPNILKMQLIPGVGPELFNKLPVMRMHFEQQSQGHLQCEPIFVKRSKGNSLHIHTYFGLGTRK